MKVCFHLILDLKIYIYQKFRFGFISLSVEVVKYWEWLPTRALFTADEDDPTRDREEDSIECMELKWWRLEATKGSSTDLVTRFSKESFFPTRRAFDALNQETSGASNLICISYLLRLICPEFLCVLQWTPTSTQSLNSGFRKSWFLIFLSGNAY